MILTIRTLGDYDERLPRHAKAYRNFYNENKRLQNERIAAFTEYISDVKDGNFPDSSNLINMEEESLQEVIRAIEENK